MRRANGLKRIKPDRGDDLMNRARAARCLLESRPFDEDARIAAFMAIFHNKLMTRHEVEKMKSRK